MEDHAVLVTQEGLAKLKSELEELKTVRRPAVGERIRLSKELTSTQNNAEFDDAKNEQAFVEGRILTLEQMITDATIIDEEHAHRASRIEVGSNVTVSEGKGKEPKEFHIVGSAEADPTEGRISNESPVGIALLGKRVGDEVQVNVPKGILRYTITKIN
ncbi:MAG: transcription elongation factor GreA [Chloroflexi bacterium]|nr:transcription elongation factor GreA [Chloroflexota bacterium]MCI0890793.1 transcription elongation factor GreA [Chloroflexota bacterium]